MIEGMRSRGGRAYALAFYAMTHIAVLSYLYTGWLFVLLAKGETIEQGHVVPLIIGIGAIATLGGAQVLPNIAERWGGGSQPQNGGGGGQP